ncbi:hypothetical protein BU23DRAFT_452376 [Bimuria novae-zelandiae CBS 107.79]|uniref:RNase III domain-containing protein n=1 Tax=Bimuria novae-zelandiae CBS 107.79 TaxID=1447943 RepID=A0A6A5VLL5_9PLEO|nr:hypothetical protein BU23DRAFT_452376 [Bimuria novae-zelandiae CBS 107.79]
MNVDSHLAIAQKSIGYTFKDPLLGVEAVQMAGPNTHVTINGQLYIVGLNKRLALVGDAGAALVMCQQWYISQDKFGNPQNAEAWTRTAQGPLTNIGLGKLGRSLGIIDAIITAPGHQGQFGDKMVGTALEGLLGAVYQDGGEEALRLVMEHIGLKHQVVTSKPSLLFRDLLLRANMLLLEPRCRPPRDPHREAPRGPLANRVRPRITSLLT